MKKFAYSLALLLLMLASAPWPVLASSSPLLARRRWLGLLTFGFALLHSGEILVDDFGGRLEGIFFLPDFMQSGALLLIGSVLGGIVWRVRG